MALVCPACGTENRSIAKFCIECIGPLIGEFESTQLEPRLTTRGRLVEGMPSALASFAAGGPLPDSMRIAPAPVAVAEGRKGLWVSVAALGIALAVGAAGWAAAGAGGLYIYRSAGLAMAEHEPLSAATPAPVSAPPVAVALATPASSVPAALAATVAPAVPVAPVSSPLPEPSPAAAAEPVPPVKAPTAHAAKGKRPVEAVLAANPPRPEPRPQASTATPRLASADTGPRKACAGLNFIAASRCMVNECEKSAYRQTAECKSVQAQQRLMEEKRNPGLIN